MTTSDACNIQLIRNTLGIIQTVSEFFNTSKRQGILQNIIERLIIETRKKKQKTWWVERQEVILIFIELLEF